MELIDIALKCSGWAWDNLREARNCEHQIGEESLTDLILLRFKKHGQGKIAVQTFTRHQESVNGSDWEWWFTGPSGKWIGMRVQAKVINLESKEYEHLHYKNNNGFQVDLLLQDAKTHQLVPLYCMYSNWDPKERKIVQFCKSYKASVRHYGASILSPRVVVNLRNNNQKHLDHIIDKLSPLHCIFCCTGYADADLPHRALRWLAGEKLITTLVNGEIIRPDEPEFYLKDEPPYYVKQLLDNELNVEFIDIPDNRLKRVSVFEEISLEIT